MPYELGKSYSNFAEQAIIRKYLDGLGIGTGTCVDIAAGDGLCMSNVYDLLNKGWKGLSVEACDTYFTKLAKNYEGLDVDLVRTKVTPENVFNILKTFGIGKVFEFLSLDIDSYDLYVLDRILADFRPRLACVEINEKFPPPIEFTVKYSPAYVYPGGHMYGMSLSSLRTALDYHKYDLVELEYNNAFLIPREENRGRSLTDEEAYLEGYSGRRDRLDKMPWNGNVEILQKLTPEKACEWIHSFFKEHEGEFLCEI